MRATWGGSLDQEYLVQLFGFGGIKCFFDGAPARFLP